MMVDALGDHAERLVLDGVNPQVIYPTYGFYTPDRLPLTLHRVGDRGYFRSLVVQC